MYYRINKEELFKRLADWDSFLRRQVHLVACGGTALTLLNIKESTKDIDFLVPRIVEYENLIKTLKDLGYKNVTGWGWARKDDFIFDIFRGQSIHTTELLESPLKKDNHINFKQFSKITVSILNYYDLLISKLFRASSVDIDDCLMLAKAKKEEVDFKLFEQRFLETASFDVSEEKLKNNLAHFVRLLKKEGIITR